jgi:signal transduction histidine kinase
MVKAINIVLSQPLLQNNVAEIYVLVAEGNHIYAIDSGDMLYDYFFENTSFKPVQSEHHSNVIKLFRDLKNKLESSEEIYTVQEGQDVFHVFVPFVPKGEYAGALYMKNTPNFALISNEIISSFNETAIIFAALILLGLLAMFYISSYTVRERDEVQDQLFAERERHLMETINHQKEAQFTKRIYHTHHKAEKIMGFIKEDLTALDSRNFSDIKYRVSKYANFISRVIYDMKWYEPPIQTIRNPIFKTNINETVSFIIDNLFLRITNETRIFDFELELDKNLPIIQVNEFVVWEVLEPLLQNCIDHAGDSKVRIRVETSFNRAQKKSTINISDDGNGIPIDLLAINENGIKKIFVENVSTKKDSQNKGYGCFLAYEIARKRCGWHIDAENIPQGGACFTIIINNDS